ncbi:2,4-dihydroxyhept-2-ene-1,7-dioic acid aldolase [Capronia epimyces CBS 606.96]|uniref:2,4-dihydroxyhept-2-ene-1,7-dioic acid aldolase n=1 Tax=Capronia epimyces CBS 606.96 TaxID=1182542 RepID=W9XC39_9EURO|nr:2,4-dihydroxyhept-2-ene-1,7-dioic acid aldolase [Capronia epimyces CBS 606.96]EXJ77803.1 2,4-dihydroxyhept-2-ene-1,7-dioic acid aldolase [Capronia epimyces CBS 606.96]
MASVLENANTLRKALGTGSGLSFGAWQMLPGSYLSRTIARAGYDWICIDCEHGNIADNEMHESIQAIASVNVSPIVRIPANEGWMVKRALDAGAHGIIVPLLYSVEDAKKLVQTAKFPPVGKRGFGSPFSMGAFDIKGDLTGYEYMKNANGNLLTIVQIETKEALASVEEIAKVDGIDVLFVGPWDLGNNIGHPVEGEFSPELNAAIERVLKAAQAAGKWSGIYCPSGEWARKYADQGFQMISVINDMTAIPTYMAESLSKAKGSYGHATAQAIKGAAYGAVNLLTQEEKK